MIQNVFFFFQLNSFLQIWTRWKHSELSEMSSSGLLSGMSDIWSHILRCELGSERGNFYHLMFTLVDSLISFNGQQVKWMTRTHRARPCRIHFCIKSLKYGSYSQRQLSLKSPANTLSGNSASKLVKKSGPALLLSSMKPAFPMFAWEINISGGMLTCKSFMEPSILLPFD